MFCRDDGQGAPGDADGVGDLGGLVVHEDDVGGLDGGVGAQAAHGDADVRPGRGTGASFDAVPHEGQGPPWGRPLSAAPPPAPPYRRGGAGCAPRPGPAGWPRPPHRLGVAGEHDGLAHPSRLEGGHGLLRVWLHLVGDDDVAQVHPVGGHVDGGAHPVAGVARTRRCPPSACRCRRRWCGRPPRPSRPGRPPPPRWTPGGVNLPAVGLLQGAGDGVVRPALRQGGQLQQLPLVAVVGVGWR